MEFQTYIRKSMTTFTLVVAYQISTQHGGQQNCLLSKLVMLLCTRIVLFT